MYCYLCVILCPWSALLATSWITTHMNTNWISCLSFRNFSNKTCFSMLRWSTDKRQITTSLKWYKLTRITIWKENNCKLQHYINVKCYYYYDNVLSRCQIIPFSILKINLLFSRKLNYSTRVCFKARLFSLMS